MRALTTIVVLLMAVTFSACTTVPILNVTDAAIATPAGKSLTDEQVKAAIIRAGSSLGWQMKDAGAGKLVGTLALRTHTAEVEIPYSAKAYSIIYKSSVNLNESGGQIHKNYNGWIQNLNKGINTQLALS
jgi:hypothetical protein